MKSARPTSHFACVKLTSCNNLRLPFLFAELVHALAEQQNDGEVSGLRGLKAAMREMAAALAVIAVFALAFVYQPYMPALTHHDASSLLASSQSVLCGSGPAGDAAISHGPCHACRQDAAVLPPPPDETVPAYTCLVAHVFKVNDEAPSLVVHTGHYNPRAPPFAV